MRVSPSNVGFAIGNGTSRRGVDLQVLKEHGITVGCNWIFRDFQPDILVALDRAVLDALPPDHQRSWNLLTRDEKRTEWRLDGKRVCGIKDLNNGWNNNSGVTAAAYLSQILELPIVYLVGIDFFLDLPDGGCNDLYSRTTRQSQGLPLVWNNLAQLCAGKTRFIRVGYRDEKDMDFFGTTLNGFEYIDTIEEVIKWQVR